MERCRVVCHDCGYEKTTADQGGLSAKESANAVKAGHIGGQSQHYSTDGPCENVEVIEL